MGDRKGVTTRLAREAMVGKPEVQVVKPKARTAKTFYLSVALQRRARNAVLALGAAPEYLTLSGFLENAMKAELERLSVKYNQGKEFPEPDDPERKIRTGRPMSRA